MQTGDFRALGTCCLSFLGSVRAEMDTKVSKYPQPAALGGYFCMEKDETQMWVGVLGFFVVG